MNYEQVELQDHIIGFDKLVIQAISERREISIDNIVKYGVPIIDEYLGGILPSELVVVAAETGKGKTEFAMNIAIANASKGKKVLMMALEGDLSEIPLRYLQKEMGKVHPVKTTDYRFNTDPILKDLEDLAFEQIPEAILQNIRFFNKREIPSLQLIKSMIMSARDYFDVIIIDHINYIHFEGENETRMVGEIMRELKTMTDIIKKPIVLMTHVRKRERRNMEEKELTNDDIYGSSNVAKEATTILFIMSIEKHQIPDCPSQIIQDERYSGTKIITTKSRAGLPPVKLGLVYDRWIKDFVYSARLLDSVAKEEDRVLHVF